MYAKMVNRVTCDIKDVGRFEANHIIKKAEKTAIQAMKKYEGEVILYGSIVEDGKTGRTIYLKAPSVHTKKFLISAYKGNENEKPLYVQRKTK